MTNSETVSDSVAVQKPPVRIERYRCRHCGRWLESPVDVTGRATAFCRHCKHRTRIEISLESVEAS